MKVGLLALSPESWSHLATAKEEWKSAGDPPFKEILISASTVVTSSVDLNSHRSQRKIQRFSRKDFQDSVFLWESLEKYRDTDRGIIHHCKNCRDFFTNSWCRRNVWKALAILWNSAWDFLITMPWKKTYTSKFNIHFKSVHMNWEIVMFVKYFFQHNNMFSNLFMCHW